MTAATDAAALRANIARFDAFMNGALGATVDLSDGTTIATLLGLIGSTAQATEPTVTWPGRHWYDTTDPLNPILNIRAPDDASWISIDVSGSYRDQFDVLADAQAFSFPALQQSFRTRGHTTKGDRGGALYVRAGGDPGYPGAVQSADGAWWVYVSGPEGVNVRAFGAVKGGVADDSAAIVDAQLYAWANETDTLGGTVVFFPFGKYLCTLNNVVAAGAVNETGDKRYLIWRGQGMGAVDFTFRPPTASSTFGDHRYYVYDGGVGNGINKDDVDAQFFRIEHMLFRLDDANLTTGDEIWLWRQDGSGAAQNLQTTNIEVRGPGTMATGHVRSGSLDIVGATNASENAFTGCRFRDMSHILRTSNKQAVNQDYVKCDALNIHDDFFVVNQGALEIRIMGGSWIWAETPDPVSDHWMFNVSTDNDFNGASNCKVLVSGITTEMRSLKSKLVKSVDSESPVHVTFHASNFCGGGIATDGFRYVTSLHAQKQVTFRDCAVPKEFGFDFVVPNSARGGIAWTRTTLGLVALYHCGVTGDLSGNIQKVGDGGRVIARECFDLSGTAPAQVEPRDFDSNIRSKGTCEPPVVTFEEQFVPSGGPWAPADEHAIKFPLNARPKRIQAYRPPVGGSSVTGLALRLVDGDGTVLATGPTADESAGLTLDYEPAFEDRMSSPLATANTRLWKLQIINGTPTGSPTGGYGMAAWN